MNNVIVNIINPIAEKIMKKINPHPTLKSGIPQCTFGPLKYAVQSSDEQ